MYTRYIHTATLFEDAEGLSFFNSKFRHDHAYPQNSHKYILVPYRKVVFLDEVDLLYGELPQDYRKLIPLREARHDARSQLMHISPLCLGNSYPFHRSICISNISISILQIPENTSSRTQLKSFV